MFFLLMLVLYCGRGVKEGSVEEELGSLLAGAGSPTPAPTVLHVTREGDGRGTFTSTPPGINCGPGCISSIANFAPNEWVELTAKAEPGSRVSHWTWCLEDVPPDGCRVFMGEGGSVIQVKVTFTQAASGSTSSPTATAAPSGPTLTVVKEHGGSGTVTSVPSGFDCGDSCSASFDLNETVDLTAEAAPGSLFSHWTGCDEELPPDLCRVVMDEDREVRASLH